MHGHTNIKLSFSLYIPVVLVPYLLARNKRGFLVMRPEVFIDAYIVQENIRCLSRKKLAISIPRTQISLLHNFLGVTFKKSTSEFIDSCK